MMGLARLGYARDKPDYHVLNQLQAKTRAGTQNASAVSPDANTHQWLKEAFNWYRRRDARQT